MALSTVFLVFGRGIGFSRWSPFWLAIVLWALVGGEDTIEKTVNVPVEIINLPRGLVISNQYKKKIEVSLTGPRSVILDMADRNIVRQVDLSKATPGTMVVNNDVGHIDVPRSLTVQRVQPPSIILSIDKLVQKQYAVVANTVGDVAPGFEVKGIRMNPEYIMITGPGSVLSQLGSLQTSYISLDGLRRSEQLQVPLELSPAIVSLIGETSVTADIEVALVVAVKTVELPLVTDERGVDLFPKTVSVTAGFPKILLDKGKKARDLLVAHAERDGQTDQFKVIVMPQNNEEFPVEIISVVPLRVGEASAGKAKLLRATTKKKSE